MKVLGFIVCVVVWCIFCAFQEYLFKIEGFPWVMAYGFLAGTVANMFGDSVSGRK